MNNSPDLRQILKAWPYDPEHDARIVRGDDGRELLQVRTPLGIEQYEMDGRPDGLRPLEFWYEDGSRSGEDNLHIVFDWERRVATVSMASAMTAAARFTKDSRASERSPTEPVSRQAASFRVMVASAVATDSQAKRVSGALRDIRRACTTTPAPSG